MRGVVGCAARAADVERQVGGRASLRDGRRRGEGERNGHSAHGNAEPLRIVHGSRCAIGNGRQ